MIGTNEAPSIEGAFVNTEALAKARQHVERGEFPQAAALLSDFLEGAPNDPAGLSLLARVYIKQNDFQAALQLHQKLVSLRPDDDMINNALGMNLVMMGRMDEAVVYLGRAVELNPESVLHQGNAGKFYLARKDYDKALPHLEKAVKLEWSGEGELHQALEFCKTKLAEAAGVAGDHKQPAPGSTLRGQGVDGTGPAPQAPALAASAAVVEDPRQPAKPQAKVEPETAGRHFAMTACRKLLGWWERNGLNGWEPEDIPAYALALKMKGAPLSEPELTDLLKREAQDPLGLRHELGLQPKRSPEALGLLCSARCDLFRLEGHQRDLDEAIALAEGLLSNPCQGYGGLCWGYPFEQHPYYEISNKVPSGLVSAMVGQGFWDLFSITRNEKYLKACASICGFIAAELEQRDFGQQGICFSVSPGDGHFDRAVNLHYSEFLARIGRELDNDELLETAGRLVNLALLENGQQESFFPKKGTAANQQPDSPEASYTAREISCLFKIAQHLWSQPAETAYREHLEAQASAAIGGLVTGKVTPPAGLDTNIVDLADLVSMFNLTSPRHPELYGRAEKELGWAIINLQKSDGWFAHRLSDRTSGSIPYLAWGQAGILKALTAFLCATEIKEQRWGYRRRHDSLPGLKAKVSFSTREEWELAREYWSLGHGVPRNILQSLAGRLPAGMRGGPGPMEKILTSLKDAEGWRLFGEETPAGGPSSPAAEPPSQKPAQEPSQPPRQIMMPDTGDAPYGSKDWAERLFKKSPGDPWGHDWRASQQVRYQTALELLQQHVPEKQIGSVLDVGCALGHFTKQIAGLYPKARVTGVDISTEAIAKNLKNPVSIDWRVAALPQLDLAGAGPFDLVSALEVIYYVGKDHLKPSIERLHQLTRPGGWFLASVYLSPEIFPTSKAFESLIAPYFQIVRSVPRFQAVYTQFETLIRQGLERAQQYAPIAGDESRNRINKLVEAGVDLLGDIGLLERLNKLSEQQIGAQAMSHCIVLARKKP